MDQQLAERIDDCVSWWHNAEGQDEVPLHEYLGMDWDEYVHWALTGELAPTLEAMDVGDVLYWPRAGTCWVCGATAHFQDLTFVAPVCGGICIWAGWQALRLHDTLWRAW